MRLPRRRVYLRMRLNRPGMAAALLVLLTIVAVAALTAFQTRVARLPLSPTNELRILKISLGTNHVLALDPFWKRGFRGLMRSVKLSVGPDLTLEATTPHSTLVLWVEERDAAGQRSSRRFDQPAALFEGGAAAEGRMVDKSEGIVRLEFPSFARDQEHVPLQIRHGTQLVRFTVRNPQRTTPHPPATAAGIGPQLVRDTEFSLHVLRTNRHPASGAALDYDTIIRSKATPAPQWFTWKVTTFDDLGNWDMTRPQHSSRVRIPVLGRTNSPLTVIAEGVEYIPAGLVAPPDAGSFVTLQPHPRARLYGVTTLIYVGPGHYAVTNGLLSVISTAPPNSLPFDWSGFGPPSGTNWTLTFATAAPAVLHVSDLSTDDPAPRVRLRERPPDENGRVFEPRYRITSKARITAGQRVAGLSGSVLPADAHHLEVEVIGTLPPITFTIPGARPTTE